MFMFGFIDCKLQPISRCIKKKVFYYHSQVQSTQERIAETGLVKVTYGLIAFDEELVLHLFCLVSLMHFTINHKI